MSISGKIVFYVYQFSKFGLELLNSRQCLFSDETVNIMSFSRFLHLKFSFHASIFFLQIRIHFSLKKNLLLHPFWTPFRNNYSILQICEIIKLKKEQYKSEIEYDTSSVREDIVDIERPKLFISQTKSLLKPMMYWKIKSKMLILEQNMRNVYFCN